MARIGFAREAARKLVRKAGMVSPPVDVFELAKSNGFSVYRREFSEELSGVLLNHADLKAIGVNARQAYVRQRFTLAHELGHYMLGHEDSLYVDIDDPTFDHSDDLEREANEFAAELLMPLHMLKQDARKGFTRDIEGLARRYQVGQQALWLRLLDSKLV